jgi:hypothetical protein
MHEDFAHHAPADRNASLTEQHHLRFGDVLKEGFNQPLPASG